MPRDVKKYLFDIIQACEFLQEYIKGKTFADYSADRAIRSVVERQFEIIGEALNLALRVEPELDAQITETGRVIGFRNQLIHGYASINNKIVWGILETKLPVLYSEVKKLLDEFKTTRQ